VSSRTLKLVQICIVCFRVVTKTIVKGGPVEAKKHCVETTNNCHSQPDAMFKLKMHKDAFAAANHTKRAYIFRAYVSPSDLNLASFLNFYSLIGPL